MIRPSDDTAILRTVRVVELGMPHLKCTGCGHQEDHFFYYSDETYSSRYVTKCPNCGRKILGVIL